MSEEVFHFQQFDVFHSGAAMKVGTDGVLLGLLANAEGKRILDVGTGSGLVALLLAQRNTGARIVGIDIDSGAARQAQTNFQNSPFCERMESLCADINLYNPKEKFDVLACNPPYYNNSPKTSSFARDKARLTETLSLNQLIEATCRLLSDDGRLSVVLPSDTADDFVHQCWLAGLHLKRRIWIRTKAEKPRKRVVLNLGRLEGSVEDCELALMTAEGTRTKAYQTLIENYFVK